MGLVIPSGLMLVYQEAGDALLEFGRRICSVYYPALQQECPNCHFNPMTNSSTGRYKSGGPYPFPDQTMCPYCQGAGFINNAPAPEAVKLNVYWNPKEWVNIFPGLNIDQPNAMIQTRGYIEDLPKLMRCEHIKIDNGQYGDFTFTRASEQVPYGMREAKYCMGYWKRK